MGLLAELLGAQYVELAHLSGESLGVGETLGEEHDLSDQGVVWNHHGHRAEAHLILFCSGGGGERIPVSRGKNSLRPVWCI